MPTPDAAPGLWRHSRRLRGFTGRIQIAGELGIRHEYTVAVTPDGCENLAPKWSEEPAMV